MSNRALFLDRDGVINIDKNHVFRIEDFEFVDGIFDLCRKAQKKGYVILIVTNQGGIGRGYYTEDDYRTLTAWMVQQFLAEGIKINKVYYCPYHPYHGLGEYRKESFDRKPNPGMFLRGRDEFDIDMAKSILVGDKETDIQAAKKAGVGKAILLRRAEFTSKKELIQKEDQTIADKTASSLEEIMALF